MAAYLQKNCKSLTNNLRLASKAFPHRKELHTSVYDKNVEDLAACPTMVPENVVDELNYGKNWAPHPTTRVFGPEHTLPAAPVTEGAPPAIVSGSVLEQEIWFRHAEDGDEANHI